MNRRALLLGGVAVAINVGFVACGPDPVTAPSVTVQRLNVAVDDAGNLTDAGCWVTLVSSDDGGNVSTFALDDSCPAATGSATCLLGGSDRLRLLVTYDGLALAPGAGPPQPTVTETLDGVAVDAGASVAAVPGSTPNAYVATLVAPSRVVSDMLLGVDVTAGYAYQVPQAFSVNPPGLTLDLSECNVSECAPPASAAAAGVGSAVVNVGVPGPVSADVTVTTRIGGAVQMQTYTAHANQPGAVWVTDACGGPRPVPGFTGSVTIPTPSIDNDQQWQVCAQYGGSAPVCKAVFGPLTAPAPKVTVEECDAGCMPKQCTRTIGTGTVSVDVAFPGTASTQASLYSRVDGVLQGTPTAVTLATQTFDGDGGSWMTGTATVQVPTTPGKWTIVGQVSAYPSPPVPVQLVQPNVAPVGALTQPGCDKPPALCAGLGPASMEVAMEGVGTPQNVTLTWFLNEGQALDGGIPALDGGAPPYPSQVVNLDVVQAAVCGPVSGSAFLPVPSIPSSDWEIWWQSGTAEPKKLLGPVAVLPPPVNVQLSCGGTYLPGNCGGPTKCPATVSDAGATADLMVTAPPELSSTQVSAFTVVDGVPSAPVPGTLVLNPATSQLEGHLAVPVPASGAWQIYTTVGGFVMTSCYTL